MLSPGEYQRYQRQIRLPKFGLQGQEALKGARVLVIGAGGLGCPALQYMAAAGVGTLGIADHDQVSLDNLQRQVLYTTDDIGKPKAECAAARLKSLNREITVTPYPVKITQANAIELLSQFQLVLDGTDNFASRYLINDACVLLDIPFIYGSVSSCEGQLAVFNAPDADGIRTNYRDLFPAPPKAGEVKNCDEAGVLGFLPGIIGTWQAAEAIKFITGIGAPMINVLRTYDALSNNLYDIHLSPAPGLYQLPYDEASLLAMTYEETCNALQTPEIDADTFEEMKNSPSTLIVDVREYGEYPEILAFEHSCIPLSEMRVQVPQLDENNVILLCSSGTRSAEAARLLLAHYGPEKQIWSLKGGLGEIEI